MKTKIVPDSYFSILLILSILVHFNFPILKIIAYPYSLAGILIIIVGCVLVFKTNSVLLKQRTSIKPFETPRILITSGMFGHSRNPIYAGMAIILLGITFILGSLLPFSFPIIFVLIIDKTIIPAEEANLEQLFGEKYLEYKTRVRRWI